MSPAIQAWFRQTSTIHGIGAVVATLVGVIVFRLTGSLGDALSAVGFAFGAVAVVLKEDKAQTSSLEKLVSDSVQAIATKRIKEMMPTVAMDVQRTFMGSAGAAGMTVGMAEAALGMVAPAAKANPLGAALYGAETALRGSGGTAGEPSVVSAAVVTKPASEVQK